jgi:anti-sigma regulatory factor (Ser/Thr protein kinase)
MEPLPWAEIIALALLAFVSGAACVFFLMRRQPAAAPVRPPMMRPAARRSIPLQMLLPSEMPVVDGLRLSASYVPGGDGGGGGDFYDAFFLDDDTIAVAIGDAAGGGNAAVASMNAVRHAIRSAFIDGARPSEVLRRANRALLRSDAPGVVTAIVGVLDPATLLFRYAGAGHATPLLALADGTFGALPGAGSGIPLGAIPHHVAGEHYVTLPVDGLLALYTDGCVGQAGDPETGTRVLGEALAHALVLKPNRPATVIDRAIFGERERSDDAAILTIVAEPTLAHVDTKLAADPASAALARGALRRFFAGTAFDERRIYDALVATGEAVSNVIEHAYGARPNQWFSLRAFHEGDDCVVVVEDGGTWQQDDLEPRGRGVAMMRTLSDACTIERGSRGTSVMLRFALVPSIADVALRA